MDAATTFGYRSSYQLEDTEQEFSELSEPIIDVESTKTHAELNNSSTTIVQKGH